MALPQPQPPETALPAFASADEVIRARAPADPVYCLYRTAALEAARAFVEGFPGDVLYAVKANPAPVILDLLYEAGVRHFDTASIAEIRLIRTRFPDARCYYMSPVRVLGTAGEAYHTWGVRDFVIDSTEELDKILDETRARDLTIYVRLKADVGGAVLELSSKFGTSDIYAAHLLQRINSIGLRPALAFHVGSQCTDPTAFARALEICGQVIGVANVELAALDVGGGFPAPYEGVHVTDSSAYFENIRQGVEAIDLAKNAHVISEPGRVLSGQRRFAHHPGDRPARRQNLSERRDLWQLF